MVGLAIENVRGTRTDAPGALIPHERPIGETAISIGLMTAVGLSIRGPQGTGTGKYIGDKAQEPSRIPAKPTISVGITRWSWLAVPGYARRAASPVPIVLPGAIGTPSRPARTPSGAEG